MTILSEGMRSGDLEDLILPLISVDEYQSKIDDAALVIAFYVSEKGAADDLNRFIQRSPVSVVDTDISPAPDQQGYFMVFVELLHNDQTAAQLTSILGDVAMLGSVSAWKMHVRGHDTLIPFSDEKIADILKSLRDQATLKETVLEFLSPSILTDADFDNGKVTLRKGAAVMEFEYIALGPVEQTLTEHALIGEPVDYDLACIIRGNAIRSFLGEEWEVSAHRANIFQIKHESSKSCLLMRRSH